jgi:hypothetical protein
MMATVARFLAVKDWHRFQHYSDRNPPWIKFYTELLANLEFLQMPEAAQAQLAKLWLLRAQFGRLPNDPKLLAGKIAVKGKFHLQAIIDAGFLVLTDNPAVIEERKPPASTAASNGASETDSTDEQNASGSVPASARSRESRELEGDTSLLHSALLRFVGAANRGLEQHPRHPQPIAKLTYGQASALQATEKVLAAGVPIDIAEQSIFDLAISHKSKAVSSLLYFVDGVIERWQRQQATADSKRSSVQRSSLEDRARCILAIANTHGLTSYIGNPDDYRRRREEAAEDPRAFPDFLDVTAKLDLAHGIGNQPEPFALKELVRRLESAPANGVHA